MIMKRSIYWCILLCCSCLFWAACTPEKYELGAIDVEAANIKQGTSYTIEHDPANPNIIHLTSLMDSRYTPLWQHPQGRSQEKKVTLNMAFPGTYDVVFGVQTRGGIVYGDTATFEVENFYAGFVDNELWTFLSGGVDQEKIWYLDLDAQGSSKYFLGPMYFYGTADSWATVTEGKTVEGDSWNWKPEYKSNTWLMAAGDYGTMTFSLKGGANVVVDHKMLANRGLQRGTYMLDTDNYTMRMNGAMPLHNRERDTHVVDWGDIRIMSLTEDYMQLGVLRDKALSGEDPAYLVYNFVSKAYYENALQAQRNASARRGNP